MSTELLELAATALGPIVDEADPSCQTKSTQSLPSPELTSQKNSHPSAQTPTSLT
jgi:hypothetical protein